MRNSLVFHEPCTCPIPALYVRCSFCVRARISFPVPFSVCALAWIPRKKLHRTRSVGSRFQRRSSPSLRCQSRSKGFLQTVVAPVGLCNPLWLAERTVVRAQTAIPQKAALHLKSSSAPATGAINHRSPPRLPGLDGRALPHHLHALPVCDLGVNQCTTLPNCERCLVTQECLLPRMVLRLTPFPRTQIVTGRSVDSASRKSGSARPRPSAIYSKNQRESASYLWLRRAFEAVAWPPKHLEVWVAQVQPAKLKQIPTSAHRQRKHKHGHGRSMTGRREKGQRVRHRPCLPGFLPVSVSVCVTKRLPSDAGRRWGPNPHAIHRLPRLRKSCPPNWSSASRGSSA